MLNIVLVDDEIDALKELEKKLNKYIKEVSIVKCNSLIDSIEAIKERSPDIIFVEIRVLEKEGFTFLENYTNKKINLILTLSHYELALRSFKIPVIDYLLKPIDKNELIAVIDKVKTQQNIEDKLHELIGNLNGNHDKINISSGGKVYLLEKEDVILLKSDKSYTKIYLVNKQEIVVYKTLKEVENKFNFPQFFRTHKSYLINLNHIKEYLQGTGGELNMTNGQSALISDDKKAELFRRLYFD